MEERVRRALAEAMRRWADLIHPGTAFRAPGISFEIVMDEGLVVDEEGRRGCPLWYRTQDYNRAFRLGEDA